jgi:GAF domain-containing protein
MENHEAPLEVPAATLENWQEIANVLAGVIGIPAALIMRLNGPDIEVFVSSQSKANPYRPGAKEKFQGSGLYCETVIKTNDKLLVPNALLDENWEDNPDIKLGMISYLGFPIILPNHKPFGTICILDDKENPYSAHIEKLMLSFRGMLESHLELIYVNQKLGDTNKRMTDYLTELQALRGLVTICANCKSIRDDHDNWYPVEHYLVRHPEADFTHTICPDCMKKLYPEFS